MSAQVYSSPAQGAGRRKAFLEWTDIDISYKLSLACGSNVNYFKNVNQDVPTLPVGIGNTQAIFIINL